MPGLVPGIRVFTSWASKTWMAGTSPAMTVDHSSISIMPAPEKPPSTGMIVPVT